MDELLSRRGVAIHALSGIDITLWDIKGKVLGQPVSELIGAPQRDRVRAYASMLMPDTPAEVREVVTEMRERGFTAVKLGWGPLGQGPANDIALAAAACHRDSPRQPACSPSHMRGRAGSSRRRHST